MTEAFDPAKIQLEAVDEVPQPQTEAQKRAAEAKAKKKPKYTKGRYTRLPPTKVINKGIADSVNATILKDKKQKLKQSDTEVGEAIMYMVEYYTAIDVNHPVLVFMSAAMSLSFTIIQLANKEDEPGVVKKKKTGPKDHETVEAEFTPR